MIGSILEDDFCIAVLTYHNPNVFCELAIAQCAARPVIILIEKGQTIPFDIRDLRAIEYDFKPRALRDKVYVQQIVEAVRSLEASNWAASVPFGNHLRPLGGSAGQFKLHDRLENFGNSDRWVDFLRGATNHLDLAGMSLRWWTKSAQCRAVLEVKAKQGCRVRILIMHQENPALCQFVNSNLKVGGVQHVAAEIESTHLFFRQLAATNPNIEVRQIRSGCLHQQIMRADDRALIALMLYAETSAQLPLLEVSSHMPLHQTMVGEFEALWNLNAPTDSRFAEPPNPMLHRTG